MPFPSFDPDTALQQMIGPGKPQTPSLYSLMHHIREFVRQRGSYRKTCFVSLWNDLKQHPEPIQSFLSAFWAVDDTALPRTEDKDQLAL